MKEIKVNFGNIGNQIVSFLKKEISDFYKMKMHQIGGLVEDGWQGGYSRYLNRIENRIKKYTELLKTQDEISNELTQKYKVEFSNYYPNSRWKPLSIATLKWRFYTALTPEWKALRKQYETLKKSKRKKGEKITVEKFLESIASNPIYSTPLIYTGGQKKYLETLKIQARLWKVKFLKREGREIPKAYAIKVYPPSAFLIWRQTVKKYLSNERIWEVAHRHHFGIRVPKRRIFPPKMFEEGKQLELEPWKLSPKYLKNWLSPLLSKYLLKLKKEIQDEKTTIFTALKRIFKNLPEERVIGLQNLIQDLVDKSDKVSEEIAEFIIETLENVGYNFTEQEIKLLIQVIKRMKGEL